VRGGFFFSFVSSGGAPPPPLPLLESVAVSDEVITPKVKLEILEFLFDFNISMEQLVTAAAQSVSRRLRNLSCIRNTTVCKN